ncbi:MAG: hypothetical protein J0I98_06690 [Mesorhizobium sp.]|nr:hypothetical protein [Mesorhizobium sp.]MBN9242462.1 hypothetical protein [Mesorhizobium sp.]
MIAQRTPAPYGADLIDGLDPVYGDVTIPPGNRTVRVCNGWPECGCEGDCDGLEGIVLGPTPAESRILFAALLFVALAGLGLIWLGLR